MKHLSHAEIALALKLHQDGKEQAFIGQQLGVSQPAICQLLHRFQSTVDLAQLFCRNSALKVTEATVAGVVRAAKAGNPEHGLELLDRLDVAPRRQDSGRSGVQVVVCMEGQTEVQPPVLSVLEVVDPDPQRILARQSGGQRDLSPATFAQLCAETEQSK